MLLSRADEIEIGGECSMRVFVGILLFSTVLNIGLGQEPSPVLLGSDAKVRIQKLTIDATNLPDADRKEIIHLLEHRDYRQVELQSRIESTFRNLGYFKARVDEPTVSVIRQSQGTEDVDVSVKVQEGTQYRLGDIQFQHASLFPANRMRAQFQIQTGGLFNSTTFSKGLDELRKLYATEGYINCVVNPVPRIDEQHRTINLILELDEGEPYDFGQLFLDGIEPKPGAGSALMGSWKTALQGKRYNPVLLKSWLLANTSHWPGAAASHWDMIEGSPSNTVNIRLLLP